MKQTYELLEVNLTILGENKPYLIDVEFDVCFDCDNDKIHWIDSLIINSALVIDRFDDSWEVLIIPDKSNFLYRDILLQIENYILDNKEDEILEEYDEYLSTNNEEFDKNYYYHLKYGDVN